MFNDNYAVGGTDRYHRQLQGYPPHITYAIPASKLKKLIAFIKTLLLIMFGWTSTFKYYYETPKWQCNSMILRLVVRPFPVLWTKVFSSPSLLPFTSREPWYLSLA